MTDLEPLSPEVVEAMDRDYRAGKSLRDIAREHNLQHTRVHRALLAHGTPMRLPGFLNTPRDERIRELSARGYSLSEIGNDVGVSRQRIHQVLNRKKAAQ